MHRVERLRLTTSLLAAASVLAAGGSVEAIAPILSFVDATLRLPAGIGERVGRLIVKAEGITDPVTATVAARVADLGSTDPGPATVQFDMPVEVERGATSRAWLVTARVKDLPANSSSRRFARLSYGTTEQVVAYVVTDLPPDGLNVVGSDRAESVARLVGPPHSSTAASITITTGEGSATGVRLAQASLRDALAVSDIGLRDLELCESAAGPCRTTYSVDARSNRTLYIRLKSDWKPWTWRHGKYTGALSFGVNERPELQTINVTLQATSWLMWFLGLVLLTAGTSLGLWTNVWARARLLRLEALKPVRALQATITGLYGALVAAPPIPDAQPTQLRTKLKEVNYALTDEAMDRDGLLPPKQPPPISVTADTAARLREYLDRVGRRAAGLTIVVREGMGRLWADWERDKNDPARVARITTALQRLDREGAEVADAGAATTLVQNVLAGYLTAVGRQADPAAIQVKGPNFEEVTWEIARIERRLWFVALILIVLGGFAVLVYPNAGFGTFLDLVFCLFWGLGLPIGADRLQQLGPGSIASTIGVPIPKASP